MILPRKWACSRPFFGLLVAICGPFGRVTERLHAWPNIELLMEHFDYQIWTLVGVAGQEWDWKNWGIRRQRRWRLDKCAINKSKSNFNCKDGGGLAPSRECLTYLAANATYWMAFLHFFIECIAFSFVLVCYVEHCVFCNLIMYFARVFLMYSARLINTEHSVYFTILNNGSYEGECNQGTTEWNPKFSHAQVFSVWS